METVLKRSELTRSRVALILTNYPDGGVRTRYESLFNIDSPNTPLLEVWDDFPKRQPDGTFSPQDQKIISDRLQNLIKTHGIKKVFLSGCMKQIFGLDAGKVINIHSGPIHGEYG